MTEAIQLIQKRALNRLFSPELAAELFESIKGTVEFATPDDLPSFDLPMFKWKIEADLIFPPSFVGDVYPPITFHLKEMNGNPSLRPTKMRLRVFNAYADVTDECCYIIDLGRKSRLSTHVSSFVGSVCTFSHIVFLTTSHSQGHLYFVAEPAGLNNSQVMPFKSNFVDVDAIHVKKRRTKK